MRLIEELRLDFVYALRQFVRQPKFWSIVVLTLAVGITASTSMFAVVDGVLLKPLPYPEPDRLVRVGNFNLRGEYEHTKERVTTLDVAAYYPAPREVTLNIDDQPLRLPAAGVTSDLFDVLGVQPVLGRAFGAEEMRPGGPGIIGGTFWRSYGVVMLSADAWRRLYAGNPEAIGSTISIEGLPHTVVGVMPPEFSFPAPNVELWFPHNIDPDDLWAGNVAAMIGRLRDGYSIEAAQQDVRAAMIGFRELIPWGGAVEDYGRNTIVRPLVDDIVGDTRPVLIMLLGAIGLVLLVVCVNVANLLLARGVSRERELATRAALGADRRRLVRQLLVENVTIAIFSGVVAVVLTSACIDLLVQWLPGDLPRTEQIAVDGRVQAFALVISVVTAIAFGLLPALRATSDGRDAFTRIAGGVVVTSRERKLANNLASVELAVALVLVIGAVLLLRSLANLNAVDPGFRVDSIVTANVSPPGFVDRESGAKAAFTRSLVERLEQAPGIRNAAVSTGLPFDPGLFGTSFELENPREIDQPSDSYRPTAFIGVSGTYFETLGIPVLAGRSFGGQDSAESQKVVIVSQSLALKHWGEESPLGDRLLFHYDDQPGMVDGAPPWFTVVGVVDDIRFEALAQDTTPMIYAPIEQFWTAETLRVAVLADRDVPGVPALLRSSVTSADPRTPVTDVRTFEAKIGATIDRPRFATYAVSVFSVVALLLASIGVYGVLAYAVSSRIREIGVRMALGANETTVFRLLFGQGLRLTVVGLVIGVPIALGSTRLLSGMLFGVEPTSFGLIASVTAFLLAIGVAASYLPARRAMRIDAMQALRTE